MLKETNPQHCWPYWMCTIKKKRNLGFQIQWHSSHHHLDYDKRSFLGRKSRKSVSFEINAYEKGVNQPCKIPPPFGSGQEI